MLMVLLAIIGAKLNIGVAYWICYGIWCASRVWVSVYKVIKDYRGG